MTISIMLSLPTPIQNAIQTYAQAAHLSAQTVIEFAIARFLELDNLNNTALDDAVIQAEIERYASEAEMPVEFVIELAITHFLDPDAVTFDDCQIGVQQQQIQQLQHYSQSQQANVA
jgi:predicted transcriptional regulator